MFQYVLSENSGSSSYSSSSSLSLALSRVSINTFVSPFSSGPLLLFGRELKLENICSIRLFSNSFSSSISNQSPSEDLYYQARTISFFSFVGIKSVFSNSTHNSLLTNSEISSFVSAKLLISSPKATLNALKQCLVFLSDSKIYIS